MAGLTDDDRDAIADKVAEKLAAREAERERDRALVGTARLRRAYEESDPQAIREARQQRRREANRRG